MLDAPRHRPLKKYNLEALKVLVADDDRNMRSILRNTLEAYGFGEIELASNGAEACKRLLTFPADLLITDWLMTPMDGIEVIRTVRTAPDSPDPYLPIILLTGYSERERVFQARDTGVTAFMAKPITAGKLFARIVEIIEHRRPFVANDEFFGPCRRRHKDTDYAGEERRLSKPRCMDMDEKGLPLAAAPVEIEKVRTGSGRAVAIGEI